MAKDRKRRGPRPKGEFEDKRRTLSTRITEETREHLEQARASTGRSLSQEIEFRLEQSFKSDQVLAEVLGGTRAFEIFRQLSLVAKDIEREMSEREVVGKWTDDFRVFAAVIGAWEGMLPALAPEPTQEMLSEDEMRSRPTKPTSQLPPETNALRHMLAHPGQAAKDTLAWDAYYADLYIWRLKLRARFPWEMFAPRTARSLRLMFGLPQ
jgi:hypothetical protein